MSTLFSRILAGEVPAAFVYSDDRCAAFLDIAPAHEGHTLVVPRAEVDSWLDLEGGLAEHLFAVAGRIGRAQRATFGTERVAMVIAGFDVPHVHLHLIPAEGMQDLQLGRGGAAGEPAAIEEARRRLSAALDA